MSELKAETFYLERESGERYAVEFYIKSEADKVIEELEQKLARAQLVLRLNKPEALFSNLDTMCRLSHEKDVVARRERHQRRKRCLAMADMCREALCYWDNVKYTFFKGEAYCFRKMNHYGKWGQIWLAIAEKFKEAK